MGETNNISIMAEKISKEIFSIFMWEKVGPTNVNWGCVQNEKHKNKSTHPSDIVFRYEDPYAQKFVYINFDLKSYAKDSITKTSIKNAIENLAMSTECAQISSEWQKIYSSDTIDTDIVSSLFVYNHDNSFDKNFDTLLLEATKNAIPMSSGNKIFIFSPSKIQYLLTITNDINVLKGKSILPIENKNITFYYPTLNKKVPRNPWKSSATIEMLLGPWQIIKYRINSDHNTIDGYGIIVYYGRKGEKQEEFQYLLDYLFHYQLITDASKIMIRVVNSDKYCASNFEKAINEYKQRFKDDESEKDETVTKLKDIEFESINNIITTFSEINIGMDNE